jgi:hypothetical protein
MASSKSSRTAQPMFLSFSYAKPDEALLHTNCPATGETRSDLVGAFQQNGFTLQGGLKLLHGGVTRAVLKDDRWAAVATTAAFSRNCHLRRRQSAAGSDFRQQGGRHDALLSALGEAGAVGVDDRISQHLQQCRPKRNLDHEVG